MDFTQSTSKEYEKLLLRTREEDDVSANLSLVGKPIQTNALQLNSNTTNSSRKSSFSENTCGTTPTNVNSLITNRTLVNDREPSFNLIDEQSQYENQLNMTNLTNCIATVHNLFKSSSTLTAHDFLKKYPKCFGAKFTGLPGNYHHHRHSN